MLIMKQALVLNSLLLLSANSVHAGYVREDNSERQQRRGLISFDAFFDFIGSSTGTAPPMAPTETPTGAPSKTPTLRPSRTPSVAPTKNPTSAPTQPVPTMLPSDSPSQVPSEVVVPSDSPSQVPSGGPTPAPPTSDPAELQYIAEPDVLDDHSLEFCQGDCDSDKDCAFGLVCFQRSQGTSDVPGCVGDANLINSGEDDFCIEPQTSNTLVIAGDEQIPASAFPLRECQGDCDTDGDCSNDLLCFQRDGISPVPNCVGDGETAFDYCYSPPDGFGVLTFVGDVENDYFVLRQCQGDCDFDSDCAIGLVCFFRGLGDGTEGAVPGCIGDAEDVENGDEDFCIPRPTPNTLSSVYDDIDGGVNGQRPIGLCSGDCDTDADCVGSLTCFQRPGVEAVPGCIGEGESDYDYCIQS